MVEDITDRKKAEEARFRHAAVIESSDDAIASGTLDGIIVSWNAGAQKIYGYTEAEAVGKSITILVPPELADEENKILETLKAGGRIEHFETVRVTKTGKRINVSLTISPIKDSTGKTVGISGIARDITQRKMAEERLREYERAVEGAEEMIAVVDREYRYLIANHQFLKMRNMTREQVVGRFAHEVLNKDFFESVVKPKLDECFKGKVVRYETKYSYPERGERDLFISYFPIEGGNGINRAACILHDITDRKRAEEALLEMNRTLEAQGSLLRSGEELLRVFVKNVPAAVAMLDRDMRYLQVSDRWCSDYLPGRAQILGRCHYEIFPDMPERWKEVHRRALQGETLRADEDRWDGQDGTHWARWEVRPWKTAEGVVGGILILAEDITRRKQMEEALSDLSRKLIESQEQERARIGRELHDDINQRLAMLSVELEQLQENPREIQPRVKELRRQMAEVSNDVQALSHDLHSSKLEYLGVVAGIKSWCREFAERQKMEIDFRSEVSSVLPPAVGLSLFRVLQEALNNAIKHSAVKRIEVQLREEYGEIHLVIRDLGRGFDMEAASQGKGLGLTSMRERVRLVNGTISIASRPMAGTTIHVRVPLGSEHAAKKEAV
jgi:PAS domain S-box-containing protein